MVEYVFTLDDLGRLRFAISPPWELVTSLRVLRDPSTAGVHVDWVRSVRGTLGGLDLRPTLALLARPDYTPDFITPPPISPLSSIEEGLDQIRAAPIARVRREVGYVIKRRRLPELQAFLDHPRRELNRLVAALAEYWERVFAPSWPRVRALLEADIAQRARLVAERGAAPALDDLHPGVRWSQDRLRVGVSHNATVPLEGRGLLLVPSAFRWSGPTVTTAEPWQPTLIYPARGVALLWEEQAPLDDALARLLGGTRARVLAGADAPVSTTELARRLRITPGGASQHLGALAAAGLVSRRREGREVLYMRTPLAESLLEHR
jgi:DNA-binding transcriptional ArsR family regulator